MATEKQLHNIVNALAASREQLNLARAHAADAGEDELSSNIRDLFDKNEILLDTVRAQL